ncbi:MAG: sce7725 family protein [Spirosomataceae bacterium]
MYLPYLRARQFELLALRELLNSQKLHTEITPILEPIKTSSNNLELAFSAFQANDRNAFLIVNPTVGEAKGNSSIFLEYLQKKDGYTFIPAFYYDNNADFILSSIKEYNLKECMIIMSSDMDAKNFRLTNVLFNESVKYIVLSDPQKNRALNNLVKNSRKKCFRLDDLFEKRKNNSEFLDIEAHKFSEEHRYFSGDNYTGFSDYTVIPSEYSEGGSQPKAIVIHLTYLDDEMDIWIRHFTSTTNDSTSDIQGKFGEALRKAIAFVENKRLNNLAIDELKNYYSRGHYPGLGTIKKISIKNHLLVVGKYFDKELQ